MTRLPAIPKLTEREHEVLGLLETWLSLAEVGRCLHVSVNTVKTHARSIYWKLGVSSRREAVAFAREAGIIRRPYEYTVVHHQGKTYVESRLGDTPPATGTERLPRFPEPRVSVAADR